MNTNPPMNSSSNLEVFEERRKGADLAAVLQLCKQMHDNQIEMGKKLDAHLSDEPVQLAEEIARLMLKAFPEGDPDGHRKHHEMVIKQAEERAEFWATMRKEIGKWGLIGFIGWAGYYLWKAALLGPK